MANDACKWGIQNILAGSIDLDTDDIRLGLVQTAGTAFNAATFQTLADFGIANVIANSGALTGKTVTAGVLDASDGNFGAVTGTACDRVVLYKQSGSIVIYVWDTFAAGMPVTPNGGTISFTVAAGTLVNFDT